MKEKWKDIEGFEGRYQISNFGNVRSLDRVVLWKNGYTSVNYVGRPIKTQVDSKGYRRVTLVQSGEKATRGVARLVAYHFLPGFKDVPYFRNVKFKDKNPSNCRVDNIIF